MPSRLKKWLRVDNLWDGLFALREQGIGPLLRPRRAAPRSARRRTILSVEPLEDRMLLSASVTARDDTFSVVHDQMLVRTSEDGVLSNDTFWSTGSVNVTLVHDVQFGSLDLRPGGGFIYRPAAGFDGQDTFVYDVDNSQSLVTINVTNAAPEAANESYEVLHDNRLIVPWTEGVLFNDADPDGDPLTAVLTPSALNGVVALDANGSFIYTPLSVLLESTRSPTGPTTAVSTATKPQ